MNELRWIAVALAAAWIVPPAAAQEPDGTPERPFEVADEPMHHIRFENDVVRVYQAMVPGDSVTLYHTHSLSGVGFNMTTNAVGVEMPDGSSARSQADAGTIIPIDADPPYVHRVLNFDPHYFRAIVAERKTDTPVAGGTTSVAGVPGYEKDLETDLAVTYRLTLAPGESTGMHTLRRNSLLVTITGGQVEIRMPGQAAELDLQPPGELGFVDDPAEVEFVNRGVVDYVAAVVEWK